MAKFNIFSLLIFLKLVIFCEAATPPNIVSLSVVFRHGDRVPNDDTTGDLTNEGRLRSYNFGVKLREQYGNLFLGDYYEPSELFALTTEYDRAKMSLQLTLAALFPPKGRQMWHESLSWQPIPYSYNTRENDVLLFPKNCPAFQQALAKVRKTKEYQKKLDPYRKLMKNLTIETGSAVNNEYDLFLLYHALTAMKSMNQTLPSWAEGIFPNGLLLNATYFTYDVWKFTDWMRKVNGGALMRKIVDDMINKTSNISTPYKLYLYSSHEMIMVAVLQTLKIWKPHIPEYSSAVILELRESYDGLYSVKVRYYKGIPPVFEDVEIPGCSTFCPLTKFIGLISDQLPDHDEIICTERDKRVS